MARADAQSPQAVECPMPQPECLNDLRLLAGEGTAPSIQRRHAFDSAGIHRKVKNDLRRHSIKEIGSRATIFDLEGSRREKRKFFVASLAEVAQRVQRAAFHQRAHLLERLIW